MTLPAGEYNLYYGNLSSTRIVEVAGKDNWEPRGLVLARGSGTVSGDENVLVCIREGNIGYVRELRMGVIGEVTGFAVPHGVIVRARIIADNQNGVDQIKVAKAEIVRLPIKVNAR